MTLRVPKSKVNLKIEAHIATLNPEVCQEFITCHKQEMKKINVDKLGSFNSSWTRLERCVIVIARDLDNNGKMVAGIRIEPWNGANTLPMIDSLSGFKNVNQSLFLKPEDKDEIAEVCGLWVSSTSPGLGRIITRAAFSAIHQIGLKKSIAFVSRATIRTAKLMGYQHIDTIGESGGFPYPSAEHTSYVMLHPDASQLSTAHKEEKELINEVNKKRIFLRAEPKKNSRFLIQYYLNLKSEIKTPKTNYSKYTS